MNKTSELVRLGTDVIRCFLFVGYRVLLTKLIKTSPLTKQTVRFDKIISRVVQSKTQLTYKTHLESHCVFDLCADLPNE